MDPRTFVVGLEQLGRLVELHDRFRAVAPQHQQQAGLTVQQPAGALLDVVPPQRLPAERQRRIAVAQLGDEIGEAGLDPGQEVAASSEPRLVEQAPGLCVTPPIHRRAAARVEVLG